VKDLSKRPKGTVGIMVAGEVAAYLVSAKRLEALEEKEKRQERKIPRPSIRGTVEIVGDLEQGSREAAREIELMALRSWQKQGR
jgi:hypothetical protein